MKPCAVVTRVLVALCLAVVCACEDGPLFEPDGLHLELQRIHAAETGYYARHFPGRRVCLSPEQPLCYCDATGRDQALAGLPDAERLDVNVADAVELQTLPGIGPALAGRIVAHRERVGLRTPADLLEVRGIGSTTLERLLPLIRFPTQTPDRAARPSRDGF